MSKTSTRGWAGQGSTYRWRRLRLVVLARDGYVCMIRGAKCTGAATCVDHVIARERGGTDDLINLRASCQWCNASRAGGNRRRPDDTASRSTVVEPRTVW